LKLLVSWLRDFVDLRQPVAEVASRLSMCGFEVAGIESVGSCSDTAGLQACAVPDAVIDFEITANRPDCLSVSGLAREAATAFGVPLRLPWADPSGAPVASGATAVPTPSRIDGERLSVSIEAVDLCPRYAAAVAEVTIGPSPDWLAARLTAAGVRPINNVVDVTNYVLLEIGHPLHAFDLERLDGRRLCARRARPGERIRTLDGEARALDPEMLVIADGTTAQAVAGVMGGAASEVWSGTRVIALESAYFKPASVRRTSKRLGLKSEASTRFERGADINVPVVALERARSLLQQIGAGLPVGAPIDVYPAPRGPVDLALRRERIAWLLGVGVDDVEIERILAALGFGVTGVPGGWRVSVPTRRVDVSREADLIEEVARHFGYDRVPSHFPPLREVAPRPDPRMARKTLIRHVLAAAGFSEAVSWTFIDAADAAPFAGPGEAPVSLAYPLSENFAVLRPSLLPGLVDGVARNRRHQTRDVRLFEVGASFSAAEGERHRVAFALTGAGVTEHWGGGMRPADFFDAVGVVERLGEALGLPLRFSESSASCLVPGRAASVAACETRVGMVGLLVPSESERRGLPAGDEIFVAELDLDAVDRLAPTADTRVRALPRFPSIVRDISVVVDERLRSAQVRETIQRVAPATLVELREFDRYKGQGIPEGRYSLSLRLTFRASDRTLTDADVQEAMERVMAALVREHQAVQR
jgi:phenylalanyl-tRNA synthetase beta chain